VQDGSKERNPTLSLLQISRIRLPLLLLCVVPSSYQCRTNGYILSRLPPQPALHSLQYATNCHRFRRAEPKPPHHHEFRSRLGIPSSALHCILAAMARLLLRISADFRSTSFPRLGSRPGVGTAENTPHVKRGLDSQATPRAKQKKRDRKSKGREMFIRVRICFGLFAICNRCFGFRYEVVDERGGGYIF
jgi:hypothetical protein